MKKIFLDNLPKKIHCKKECIDWMNSIGYKVRFIYDDIEGEIEIIEYKKCRHPKIKIKYNNKYDIITIESFKNIKLGKILNKVTKDFKIEIGQTFKDDERDLTIIDREYRENKNRINEKWYKYHCNKCGYEGWKIEGSLLKYIGCSCCSNRIPVFGINTIWDTDQWMIPIVGEEFSKSHVHSCSTEIKPICPICRRKSNKKFSVNYIYQNKYTCPNCSDGISYPNKFMFNLLKQLNIEFETEYSPEWIKPKRYDFYIPSMNLIIEMDGGLGHGKKVHSKSNKTLEQSIQDDNYKDKLAQEHGLKVIRIDCDYENIKNRFEYIKENSINKLNSIFDLNNIDWINIQTKINKNMIIECCDLYKEGIYDLHEISNITNLNYSTVCIYLKYASKIGLCKYKTRLNPVYCVNNDTLYENSVDASKKLNIPTQRISDICKNKVTKYKILKLYLIKNMNIEELKMYNIKNKLIKLINN